MRKRPWKCPDCGMTERKEPHRTLSDHMEIEHGKLWDESQQRYAARMIEVWEELPIGLARAVDLEQGQDGRLAEYVFSDWLDEQGDPRAEAWRVLMDKKLKPRLIFYRNTNRESWRWYKYKYMFVPKESQLGKDYFLQLPGLWPPKTVVWSCGSYFRAMYEAATAWVRVERDPDFMMVIWEPISPPEDSAFREYIQYQQRAIALSLGVPASIVVGDRALDHKS